MPSDTQSMSLTLINLFIAASVIFLNAHRWNGKIFHNELYSTITLTACRDREIACVTTWPVAIATDYYTFGFRLAFRNGSKLS